MQYALFFVCVQKNISFYFQSAIFEEVDLTDLSIAECSIKNVNHSFQVRGFD